MTSCFPPLSSQEVQRDSGALPGEHVTLSPAPEGKVSNNLLQPSSGQAESQLAPEGNQGKCDVSLLRSFHWFEVNLISLL